MKTLKMVYVAFAAMLVLNACKKEDAEKQNQEIAVNNPGGLSLEGAAAPDSANVAAIEAEVLTLVNNHRKGRGLAEVQLNNVLASEARTHSSNMASGAVPFGHNGVNNRIANIRAALNGIRGWGENVAYGYSSAASVMEGWLNSPGHRRNIEGNFNLLGVGIAANSNGRLYYTQIFVNKPQ
jgi:uncharacterized protein YkwD